MSDFESEAKLLNEEIIAAHNKHFDICPTGLVIPTESPNGNTIHHLYSDGVISFQKGGWAYLQRSEFLDWSGPSANYQKLNLIFPKKAGDGTTYVVLKPEECKYFKEKMTGLLEKYEYN